ncbi:MAG TPA: tetratricopeptide repeat protein, partial [Kiloniellales bacterium]|nr:tetratricopeptide repeat protein [Kiloniellales bacterium]
MSETSAEQPDRSPGPEGPDPEAVRAQLDRIVASREFQQSDRLKRFLRHIVEETLAGRGRGLTEYAIGLDVFERPESFDPRTSSIVRVEASRLRAKLERYHAAEGRHDRLHIVLPRGGYAAVFRPVDTPSNEAAAPGHAARPRRLRPSNSWSLAGALAACLALVAVAGWYLAGLASFETDSRLAAEAVGDAPARTLAVLPLRNLSGNADDDYLGDGLTDALITGLAKDGSLRVTSLTSVMAFKNVERPLAEVAHDLGVSHVVEGSVLRVGEKIRITVQLIEAGTDRHLWAESYERDLSDVLALQHEIASDVVSSLPGRFDTTTGAGQPNSPAIDPAAYEAHLRGRYFLNKMTEDGFKKGIEYFEQAVAKAPDFAPAYSGIATCYCLLGGHGFELVRPSEGMPAAKNAVMEALRLDDTLAEAHAFLGIIRLKYEWDWDGAEQAFRRSIELDPSYAQAHKFYSYFLEAMGRQDAAIREAEAAKAIDPLSLSVNVNLGWQYLQGGRPEDARRVFESTRELDPTFWGVHWGLGQYHLRRGQFDEAVSAFRDALSAGGGHAMPPTALGYTYALAGRHAEAREMLGR